jgi:hypothetical protein
VIIHSKHEDGAAAMKSTFRMLGLHRLGALILLRRLTCGRSRRAENIKG